MKKPFLMLFLILVLTASSFAGDLRVTSKPYDSSTWNNDTTVPNRKDVRDKFESLASGLPAVTAGGTVDAITATYNPAVTLSNLTVVVFVASGANTITTPTFAPNGLTAHTIVKNGGSALVVGDIPAVGAVCILEYNLANTRWELLNPKFLMPAATASVNGYATSTQITKLNGIATGATAVDLASPDPIGTTTPAKGILSPAISKGSAIINSGFAGTISTSGSSTTITFTSAADAILAGYAATNPTLGMTLITTAVNQASVTRYIQSWTNSTQCVVNTVCTLAASSTIASVQAPSSFEVTSAGVLKRATCADGTEYFADNVGVGSMPTTKLNVLETGSASPRGILSTQISSDTNGARVGFAKARGTLGSETTVVTGDILGRDMFRGHDGASFLEMASIEVGVSGTVASTRVPTYMAFSTATDAAPSVLTERMRILNNGNVGIGTTSPTAKLHLPASTATANTASLKIDPGVVATTPVSGNVESDGTHLYWTDSGAARKQIDPAAGLQYKGLLTLTNGMNLPAATIGDWYEATGTSYWIGGTRTTSPFYVNAGDTLWCLATSAAGTYAEVGQWWKHVPRIISKPDGDRMIDMSSQTTINLTGRTNAIGYESNLFKIIQNGSAFSAAIAPTAGQITFAGPSVPRTITVPDAAFTVARTDHPILTAPNYKMVAQSPSATGTITIDAATTDKALITPTTASQADTLAFSNRPASGDIHYIRVQIIAPASGTQTIVWPTSNVYWMGGTSGRLTALTANKHYEYVCELESTNTYCSIISEESY